MENLFVLNTRTEFMRIKRTASFWLTLAAASFIPAILTLIYSFKPQVFTKQLATDPWIGHFKMGWEAYAPFMLPMYAILVCSLVVQVEYRNNTWKQVYASPRSYADIYFSKFLVIQTMILFSFTLFIGAMIISATLVNLFNSNYTFTSNIITWKYILMFSGKLYISLLAMTAIQYWLSLRFKNYIVPVGIGLALLVAGIMLLRWENIHVYPFAYTILTFLRGGNTSPGQQDLQLWSLGYFMIILLLGFWDMATRKERG